MKNTTHTSNNKGFALLFAVLISSVLLSIGISIFNLTLKELILSSSGRESQFAFYAADTGAECALYWDAKGVDIFATSSNPRTAVPANPDCVGQAITIDNFVGARTPSYAATRFNVSIPNRDYLGNSAPYCAIVTVSKTLVGGIVKTDIDSRGYNMDCASTDPNKVERGLQVHY